MFRIGRKGFFFRIADFNNESSKGKVNIVAGKDGCLYEVRDGVLGRTVVKTKEARELDPVTEGFEFSLPKMPGYILEQILCFFRSYVNDKCRYEVMVQIYWDYLMKRYFVHCPQQKVSKNRIWMEGDKFLQNHDRHVLVSEIHSHNTMRAYFSEIDNEDELMYALYGVVGRLQFYDADMRLRVGCNGNFVNLPLNAVFEYVNLSPTDTSYPEEWHEQVAIKTG